LKGVKILKNKLEKDSSKQNGDFLRALSSFSQLGITIVACLLIGVFLGRFLDNLLDTSPWLLLLFSLLGAGAAIKAVFDLGSPK
jgi:ATP synthase protein I